MSFTGISTNNTPDENRSNAITVNLCAFWRNAWAKAGSHPYFTCYMISDHRHRRTTSVQLGQIMPSSRLLAIRNASCAIKTYCYALCTTTRTLDLLELSNKSQSTPWISHSSPCIAKVRLCLPCHKHNRLLLRSYQMLSHLCKFATIFDR